MAALHGGNPKYAPTSLSGAHYPSLNLIYFPLKYPVFEIFMAFCLLLYIFWHVPARVTTEKLFVPLQAYFVGAT